MQTSPPRSSVPIGWQRACRVAYGSRFPRRERIVRRAFAASIAKRSGCKRRRRTGWTSWTLTHDTSRTGERYRKQVDNGRSRGAKGTIDVSRYAAAPRRDRDSRSKWAIPRYGYGGIKRSASTGGGGCAGTADGSCRSQVECRRESPFTAEKTAAMIVYANCLRYPGWRQSRVFCGCRFAKTDTPETTVGSGAQPWSYFSTIVRTQ